MPDINQRVELLAQAQHASQRHIIRAKDLPPVNVLEADLPTGGPCHVKTLRLQVDKEPVLKHKGAVKLA